MRKLLVANRGEIARRVFRTARDMGIATVAVYSDPDADAPFVRDADEAVRLPGATPGETYLRGDLVIDAATRVGADAVHPGYGFLSENAAFAQSVLDAGLIWIGPPPGAIATMGSKLGAKRLMRDAGVPTLPWAESAKDAASVGYPLLVKASAGGGGRGMRIVRAPADLAAAVESAQREAGGAFGDDTVFLERYVDAPRHVEIQVFADTYGTTVSLFERECSIQRRHQKIVEESPSPVVDDALRRRLGEAATLAAKAVGYVGAGTVEFILDAGGEFAFLEMNTRLQVEHPVTELVTGLDLVRLQILVAQGEPLPFEAVAATMSGHAIEVRLYAEDPRHDFLPTTGRLRAFDLGSTVRADTGFVSGGTVSTYYDPMLAKVIVHAPTRAEAAARLVGALASARIHGVTTNRDLLVRILRESEFLAGHTDTAYLERHDPATLGAPLLGPEGVNAHAVAAALALQAGHRESAATWTNFPTGWRNNPSQPQTVQFDNDGVELTVRYQFGRDGIAVSVDDHAVDVVVHVATAHCVDASIAGIRRSYAVALHEDGADVDSPLGASSLRLLPRFPDAVAHAVAGSLVAPMPGVVARVLVDLGATVTAGEPLIVLEAMKMEHTIVAPADGAVVEIAVRPGQQLDAGTTLVVLADITT